MNMKKVTLNEDVKIQGYGTIVKGTTLNVEKYNQRYIYCYVLNDNRLVIQLTYKNIGKKSPIKRRKRSLLDKVYGKNFVDEVRVAEREVNK